MTFLNRISLFMAAFMAAFALQICISRYQTTKVIMPMQEKTADIRVISQFLNDVEGCLQLFEDCRWEAGGDADTAASVRAYQTEAGRLVGQIQAEIGVVSDEYYLLTAAAKTTYGSWTRLSGEILALREAGQDGNAAAVYFGKARPCGGYLRQYTQQLLEQAIRDSQSMYRELDELNGTLRRLQAVIGAVCVALGIVVIASSYKLIRLVGQMARASDAIGRGRLDTPDVDESQDDEIGNMARAFNQMKRSMKHQVQMLEERNQMEQELLKRENEALEMQNLMEREKLQQLRSQINPHFLFNTLNVILYTSRQEKAVKTEALIGSLSKLFRYALGSNDSRVPLTREIRIVDELYALSKARFGDRMVLRWHIPPEVEVTEILTPSFLIQPLVENAFKHGLGPKEEGGCVDIFISQDGAFLEIRVADDGVGMSREALEALRENLKNPSAAGEHIGVYNVAARLRLQGDGSGLDIQSRQNAGTVATLRLPLVMENGEEQND